MASLLEQAPERQAYSIRELANAYGVSTGLIRRQIKAGRLKASRIGERRFIVLSEAIDEWLRNREMGGV